jgi:hypothetical protein
MGGGLVKNYAWLIILLVLAAVVFWLYKIRDARGSGAGVGAKNSDLFDLSESAGYLTSSAQQVNYEIKTGLGLRESVATHKTVSFFNVADIPEVILDYSQALDVSAATDAIDVSKATPGNYVGVILVNLYNIRIGGNLIIRVSNADDNTERYSFKVTVPNPATAGYDYWRSYSCWLAINYDVDQDTSLVATATWKGSKLGEKSFSLTGLSAAGGSGAAVKAARSPWKLIWLGAGVLAMLAAVSGTEVK